jgi:hypothetical protein
VQPVVVDGERLEAPASDMGILVARDASSGKEKWRVRVVERYVDKRLEKDVQDVHIRALHVDHGVVLLEDEAGTRYAVDLKTHKLRIVTWPVGLRWVAWRPSEKGWRYSVELTVTNTLNRVLKLDEPSVARGGELSNNLFRVTMDGREVRYQGLMAKRAPPSRFIELKPGQVHRVTVELGQEYPLPPGRHHVTVAFEHTNHFSPDGFTMASAALEQDLDGEGRP